jgi:hypothetical protein
MSCLLGQQFALHETVSVRIDMSVAPVIDRIIWPCSHLYVVFLDHLLARTPPKV